MERKEIDLPQTKEKVVVVHSGGLDSSTVLIAAVYTYGPKNVRALSFAYGQKQQLELERGAELCNKLGIQRVVVHLESLGMLVKGVSANIKGTTIEMPTIVEVLGDPAPVTYVPNRNMILFGIAAAYAESIGADTILCGLQSNDEYNYHDTTPRWLEKLNALFAENRKNQIKVYAPMADWNKGQEIAFINRLHVTHLLAHTLTCYNPDEEGRSCGTCPSCAERLRGFAENSIPDPIPYR